MSKVHFISGCINTCPLFLRPFPCGGFVKLRSECTSKCVTFFKPNLRTQLTLQNNEKATTTGIMDYTLSDFHHVAAALGSWPFQTMVMIPPAAQKRLSPRLHGEYATSLIFDGRKSDTGTAWRIWSISKIKQPVQTLDRVTLLKTEEEKKETT